MLITTARLREPKAMTTRGQWVEQYKPNEDSLYGRSMIKYLATKILTISPVPNRPLVPGSGFGTPEKQYVGFHVMKNRAGKNTKQSGTTLVYEIQRGANYMKIVEVGEEELKADAK